jgi:hypothetical protein
MRPGGLRLHGDLLPMTLHSVIILYAVVESPTEDKIIYKHKQRHGGLELDPDKQRA